MSEPRPPQLDSDLWICILAFLGDDDSSAACASAVCMQFRAHVLQSFSQRFAVAVRAASQFLSQLPRHDQCVHTLDTGCSHDQLDAAEASLFQRGAALCNQRLPMFLRAIFAVTAGQTQIAELEYCEEALFEHAGVLCPLTTQPPSGYFDLAVCPLDEYMGDDYDDWREEVESSCHNDGLVFVAALREEESWVHYWANGSIYYFDHQLCNECIGSVAQWQALTRAGSWRPGRNPKFANSEMANSPPAEYELSPTIPR